MLHTPVLASPSPPGDSTIPSLSYLLISYLSSHYLTYCLIMSPYLLVTYLSILVDEVTTIT